MFPYKHCGSLLPGVSDYRCPGMIGVMFTHRQGYPIKITRWMSSLRLCFTLPEDPGATLHAPHPQ
jgi:hypothetical protein